MKILQVAFPFAPVRDDTAGGAEQMLALLDRGLTRRGHRSLVIACEGSQVAGTLLVLPGAAPVNGEILDLVTQQAVRRRLRTFMERTVVECQPDLVHLHGLDFFEYLPAAGVAVVATLHLPTAWYDARVFAGARPRTWLHCVSPAQHATCPRTAALLPFICNGVSEDVPQSPVSKRNYALALGRLCPEKGFHLAFEAAGLANIPLVLAGQVHGYAVHRDYFQQEIVPRCNGRNRFIGAVGGRRKQHLLRAARCLLIPSLCPETSSLVAMEAAMCGTPVVAFRSGALPEIVEDGVTGFVVDGVEEMAKAIGECSRIDAERCRETAMRRFSERRVVGEYLQMYEQLITAGKEDSRAAVPAWI